MTNIPATQVRAAVSRGPDRPIVIEDVEMGALRDDEVLVRLVATGLCHTDLEFRRRWPEGVPIVLGHEGAGVVEAAGAAVTDVSVTDSVVLSFHSCGRCDPCRAGTPAYCRQFGALNLTGYRADGSSPLSDGAGQTIAGAYFGQSSLATHAAVSARHVVVVDHDVDLVSAAPLGCSMVTGAGAVVNVLRPGSEARLVVYGVGGVGLAAVMAARAIGVDRLVAVDLNPARLVVAQDVGADIVIDGASPDAAEQIRSATAGGATHAVDTTGVPAVIRAALEALAPLGELVIVGLGEPTLELDARKLLLSGTSIRGCTEGSVDPQTFIPQLVQWQREGLFPVEKIITRHRFADIEETFTDFATGRVLKPVVVFGQ